MGCVSRGLYRLGYSWSITELPQTLNRACTSRIVGSQYIIFHFFRIDFFNLSCCGIVLKEARSAAARESRPIVAAKLASTAQCGTVPVPPIIRPPKMSKSWLIRGGGTVAWKNEKKRDSGRKKGSVNPVSYLPHWPRSRTSLGKAYLHAQRYGNLEDLPNL